YFSLFLQCGVPGSVSEGGGRQEEAAALHRTLQVAPQLAEPHVRLTSDPSVSPPPERLLVVGAVHAQHQPEGAAHRRAAGRQHAHARQEAVQAPLQPLHRESRSLTRSGPGSGASPDDVLLLRSTVEEGQRPPAGRLSAPRGPDPGEPSGSEGPFEAGSPVWRGGQEPGRASS
uniref:Uncharacterized protein n=1 Tax=Fundulus heteroclitus TaxID=8078 RepID=A0A3Q2PC40_FUNHE